METLEHRMDSLTLYQIRVKGHLDETLASWFEGFTISNEENGDALLTGRVQDQAALQGVLNRISNLGLSLVSVNSVPEEDQEHKAEDDNERPDASV